MYMYMYMYVYVYVYMHMYMYMYMYMYNTLSFLPGALEIAFQTLKPSFFLRVTQG